MSSAVRGAHQGGHPPSQPCDSGSVSDLVIQRPGRRNLGIADFGPSDGDAVIWCHGGPGSRLEPRYCSEQAAAAGFRLIGVDRPGYGLSDPLPGRSIADWVPDALAVAAELDVGVFYAVGLSTGGAYALALAALSPQRVVGVVACCALTDMRFAPARATMSIPHTHAVWDAPDREAAIAAAVRSHGPDGSRIIETAEGPPLAPSDQAMLTSQWGRYWLESVPAMFAHGLQGYADDRIADGSGWDTFDVSRITCPVRVLHGAADVITDVVNARHTAEIVPTARLRVCDGLGHFSISDELVATLVELRDSGSMVDAHRGGPADDGEGGR